jgi:glutathione S-transferase
MTITLHHHPSNASFAPHVLLHELGVPFELALVDRDRGAHKSPGYLKLNPNGLIPVLVDGDLVLYETAAILLHLADTHPQAQLVPPLGTPERAQLYKWLIWLSNTMQATLIHYFYPHRMVAEGNTAGAEEVKDRARAAVGGHLAQIDAHLAAHGGPWFMGERYGIADPMAAMLCRWTRGFSTRPARDFAHIGPYLQRFFDRPAVQRAVATEGLPQPLY